VKDKSTEYAGVPIRGLAQAIDYLLMSAFFFPITYLVKGVWLMSPADHLWIIFDPICAVFLAVIFLYFILFEGYLGGTPGKLLLGLRVRNIDGSPISIRQSLIRNAGRMIDGLPFLNLIGIVSIARSPLRQRIGDMLAHTVVIHKRSIFQ
jgi:uncharacterized RDD family membrane protein YckC